MELALLGLFVLGMVVAVPAAAFYALHRTNVMKGEIDRLRQDLATVNRALNQMRRGDEDPADRRARHEQRAAAQGGGPVRSRPATPPAANMPPPPAAPTQPATGPREEVADGAGWTRPPRDAGQAAAARPAEPAAQPEPASPAAQSEPAEPAAQPEAGSTGATGATDQPPPSDDRDRAKAPGSTPPDPKSRPGPDPKSRPGPDPKSRPDPEPARAGVGATEALDLETVIGSTWLLRIGLGILAIALALFARTVAPQLPNIAKVGLAYAGSIAFFGVGKYFEDRLERFARPVMAGGLAFGFFVAFASYFVPAMRAVPMSASVVWMVLSMLAVLIAAERWDSEPTAMLGIVLGHISAQVTAGAADTYSLVMIGFLGLTAIVLLLRHEWINLGLIGVAGAYGAHFLWLLADRVPPPGDQGFWLNLAFLTSYYVIFLIADILWWRRGTERLETLDEVQLRGARALGPTNLIMYVSVATFVYFASGASVDAIEWYYITLGVLQCVLAWFYRDMNHRDYIYYPVFGTVLWTIGMFAALDALVLNLVLAGQALLLLLVAHRTGMRVFYYLSQVAMGVAFIHYLVYPPPSVVTVPILIGGLGIASVYLAKAALEEKWYGTAATGDVMWLRSLLGPFHAVLGGIVILREAFGFYDADPMLAVFVVGAHFVIMALAIGAAGPVLVFTLVTLAVGSPLVVVSHWTSNSLWSLALLAGLVVSVHVLLQLGPKRFGRSGTDHLAWQLPLISWAALIGGFVALEGLPTSTVAFLAWMVLPLLLLAYRHLVDDVPSAPPATPAAEPQTSGEATAEPKAGAAHRSARNVGTLMYLAIAALIVGLVYETIGADLESPLWIAAWSAVLVAVAVYRSSRGIFLTAYTLLVGGYTLFFFFDQYTLGFAPTRGTIHPALGAWWAMLFVVAIPLGVAIAIDRAMDDHPWARPNTTDPMVALAAALVPYLMALLLVGTGGWALLPNGWSFVLPAILGMALVWQADRFRMPRGVLAVLVSLLASHLYFVSVTNVSLGGAWMGAALIPLLVFALATLVTERLVDDWMDEARRLTHWPRALIVLVVLATITAMSAIYGSAAIPSGWITAGWSVLGGSMMAAGFALKSSTHRRVALGLLAICVVRVFVVDTVGLSDTARIGAFLVLGLILVGIALLYARYSDELKKLL